MSQQTLMLGIAGEIASGKSSATRMLEARYAAPSARFSDSLRDFYSRHYHPDIYPLLRKYEGTLDADKRTRLLLELHERIVLGVRASFVVDPGRLTDGAWRLLGRFRGAYLSRQPYFIPSDGTREDLQEISTDIRAIFGEHTLERTVAAAVARFAGKHPLVVIQGVRRVVDISWLMTQPNFRLVYIECDPHVAYARMTRRGENPGEAAMPLEEFLRRRSAEAESQIRTLKERAHLVIDNGGEPEFMNAVLFAAATYWITRLNASS